MNRWLSALDWRSWRYALIASSACTALVLTMHQVSTGAVAAAADETLTLVSLLMLAAMAWPLRIWLKGRHPPQPPSPGLPSAWWSSVAAGSLVLLAMMGVCAVAFVQSRHMISESVTNRLASAATLKVSLIHSWLDDTKDDIQLVLQNQKFLAELAAWQQSRSDDTEARLRLLLYLRQLAKTAHFTEIGLRDAATGELRLSTRDEPDLPSARRMALSLDGTTPVLMEGFQTSALGADSSSLGFLHLVPGTSKAGSVVVHVGVDPSHEFFPLIEQKASALDSAEALLLYNSPLEFGVINQHLTGGPRTPRSLGVLRPGDLGWSLLHTKKGAIHAIDDRGHAVLAYAEPVPESPWTLVTKLDVSEAYAELNRISLMVLAMLCVLCLLTMWWWRAHHRYLASELEHRLHQGLLAQRIDTLSRHSSDAILLCDEQGRIVDVNERGTVIYGLERDQIIGRQLEDLHAAESRPDLPATLAQLRAQGGLVQVTRHLDPKGAPFPVEISARLIEFEGHTRIHLMVHDLTERVSAQHHIVHLSRLYATISAVNQAIVRGRTLDDVLHLVCRACTDHGGFCTAKVSLADSQTGALNARVSHGMHAQFAASFALPPGTNAETFSPQPTGVAAQHRHVRVINHIRQMAPSAWREKALQRGFESVVALPLLRADRMLGTITAYCMEPGTLHEDVIQLLTEMADELALAVEHFESEARRLKGEASLRQNEARLANAQAIGRIGDWRFQTSTRLATLSLETCRLFGLAPKDTTLPLGSLLSRYDAASRKRLRHGYRLALRTRGRTEVELSTLARQGLVQQHATVMIPEFDGAGAIQAWVGTVQDITERKALEAERFEVARRLKEMSRRVVSVQEDERRRLAVELHDRTGANLAAINLNLAAIARVIRQRNSEDSELFEETRALVSDTVVCIREFCGDLRPSTLDYAGLVPALDNCLRQFGRRNHCATQLQHDSFSGQCSAEVESLLFRIAQEALLNCRKHAHASEVHIRLSGTPEHLSLTVSDNGRGFDLDKVGRSGHAAGQGLLNMRERAAFAGGDCTIISRPGHGTTVRVQLGTLTG